MPERLSAAVCLALDRSAEERYSLGSVSADYKDVAMARMLLLTLLGFGVCGGANGSGPEKRQVDRDPLKDAFDQIQFGMPEKQAFATIGLPVGSSGIGSSGPDWQWYAFTEWFAGDYKIQIRFQHGRVIKKQVHSYKD
jgi:hypothetical protein